ncbi:hypothetical protein BN1200_580036 [Klebsiella variicola]|uniref:tail fiber/spike domain-containing protein n=1 Tax=Klebsiella variicola TaxID=244366 RepID=UPI000671DDBE|nr:hypothetical protein [Klebsiella variicola]CTQ16095.1 hypothetical protein BN1200_580036 [Klebsiella variicola]VGP89511.1 hypothetical protein SB5531_02496 [Klebsiella variicola]
MTRLPESSLWEEEIELISRSERVSGGLDGVANRPLKSLANRTRYLKGKADKSDVLVAEKVSAVKTFAEGATLESPRDEILYGAYRLVWTGAFPKTVPAASTPDTTGGVGAGLWAYTSDAVIRRNLASSDGLKWIGRCSDLTALRGIEPTSASQRISTVAHSPGWAAIAGVPSGGGEFYYDHNDTTSPDDGGHTIVTALGARWKRVDQDVIPEHFGFRADSTDDQSAAVQAAVYFAVAKNRRLHGSPGKTAYIASTVYIPPYLNADWRGMTLKTVTSGMTAVRLSTGAATIVAPYRRGTPLNNLIIEGRFKAGTTNVPDTTFATNGLAIGELGSAQVSDLNFSGLAVRGFQSSLVIAGPSAYLLKFSGCDIGAAWFRGISYTASSDSGENIQFFGGSIYDCVNTGGSAQGVYISPSASAVELTFNGVSFDYNDVDLSQSHSNVTINDCHQENNNNNPKIVIFNTPAKQPAKLRINGGSMGGGPHVSGLNSTVENAKGRPCYIDITGAGTSVILDKVQVGLYNADGNVTEVVRNSGKVAVRKLEVNILQDTGPSKSEGWPLNPSFSLNKLARFPNGSTDCWTLGAGSGNTLSASTAVSAAHDTGARLLTRPATSSASSISMYQDIRVGQGKTMILKSWLQTENVISQGGSAQLQTTFLTEDKAAAVTPTSIHPRNVAADGVLTECATVLPVPPSAAWLRVAIYGTNIATGVVSKIYSSGEHSWEI